MEQILLGELTAQLDRAASDVLAVRFGGRSATRDPGTILAPLFAQLIGAARAEGRTVVLRFEQLAYFNSSTVAALIQFIRSTQEASVGLEIVYDRRQRWQAMTFEALRRTLRPLESAGAGPAVTFRVA